MRFHLAKTARQARHSAAGEGTPGAWRCSRTDGNHVLKRRVYRVGFFSIFGDDFIRDVSRLWGKRALYTPAELTAAPLLFLPGNPNWRFFSEGERRVPVGDCHRVYLSGCLGTL